MSHHSSGAPQRNDLLKTAALPWRGVFLLLWKTTRFLLCSSCQNNKPCERYKCVLEMSELVSKL